MSELIYRDVTLLLGPGAAVFPGDPSVAIQPFAQVENEGFNASALSCSLHTATHVDAPRHLDGEGMGVDRLSLEVLIGSVRVLDCRSQPQVDRDFLERSWEETERLLLRTGGGEALRRGEPGSGCLMGDGAAFLVEKGVALVGIDALSIDSLDEEELPVHRTLLPAGVVVIEGLDLSGIRSGCYQLICLPLKIQDGDGAPARVLLVDGVSD
jgi:arylformamidase